MPSQIPGYGKKCKKVHSRRQSGGRGKAKKLQLLIKVVL
jgi:hypothetical protein